MPVALVVGANGITGSYLVEKLVGDAAFSSVIATSRRPPNPEWLKRDVPGGEAGAKKLKWVAADLTAESAAQVAEKLRGAGGDAITHVFWGCYLLGDGWGSPSELSLNSTMYRTLMDAVLLVSPPPAGLKRVVLQLGGKWYFRQPFPAVPMKEMDEHIGDGSFYDAQLEITKELAGKHGFEWVVTLPESIYGSTRQCAQSLATSLAVYAFAHKMLGVELVFPGNAVTWNITTDASDAQLLAEENVWAALEPKCSGQIINAVNGDVFQWKTMWYRLAGFIGCSVPSSEEMAAKLSTTAEPTVKMAERISEDMCRRAWEEAKRTVAKDDPEFDVDAWKFGYPFNFASIILSFQFNYHFSMSKARALGFQGYKDTEEMWFEVLERMQRDGILPRDLPGRSGGRAAVKW
ncbi:hypothetical protein DFJ74DRAFT_763862 [Hyaloraphidium curvatum]|nr:hypothetical protein DFJ74DRAFT_763862 [Hyaloraphidium curvatum]